MRRSVLLACAILGLGAALSAVGFALASRPAPHRAATIDPRLLLHPQTISIRATAPRSGAVRLQLYPAIPGAQHVTLRLPAALHPSRVTLRADMPGMRMLASTAGVVRRGAVYHGTLTLAMFGVYRLQVRMAHRPPLTLRVVLPLPKGL